MIECVLIGVHRPDGWQAPFNGTLLSRDVIHRLDPYHPIAVTLNCNNYYFGEYTAGTDIVMADVYPIGVNSTFSKWGTVVNETYGNCGCDGCQGNVQDVAVRFDLLAQYEEWLGLWPKTKAQNPQSFSGEGYWLREPTIEEAVAMAALGFNHDSKGVTSWLWPPRQELAEIHGAFATVMTQNPVRDFVQRARAQQVSIEDYDIIDVSYWHKGDQLFLVAVNSGYQPINATVAIPLPDDLKPQEIQSTPWGNGTWSIENDQLRLSSMELMSTNLVIVSL